MRHSSYHTPSLPSRIGRVLLVLLCSAGVLSGGFLLLCGLGSSPPPPSLSRCPPGCIRRRPPPPPRPPRRTSPCRRKTTPSRGFPFLDQLADAQTLADGYDGVILPMKTADGALGYVSALPLAADAGASSGDPDRNEVLRALNDTPGLYTVAQVSCLRDSALVREEPGLSLHRVSGSPWLDESRQGWLDPAQPQVQSYLIGLCRELAQLGFDEILLTDCGFPTQGDLDSLRAVEEKEETLETFCRQLQGALADTPVTLSVMGQRDSVTADPVSGQTTALLATFGRVWTQAEDQEALAAFDPVVLPAVS